MQISMRKTGANSFEFIRFCERTDSILTRSLHWWCGRTMLRGPRTNADMMHILPQLDAMRLMLIIYRWHSFCYCEKHFYARRACTLEKLFRCLVLGSFAHSFTSSQQLANNLRPIVFYSINCKLFQFGKSKDACAAEYCCYAARTIQFLLCA